MRNLTLMSALAAIAVGAAHGGGFDPVVPFDGSALTPDEACREFMKIREKTGLRRFLLVAPGFKKVMFGPFPDGLYADIGRQIAAMRGTLADTDIELSWWCSPSIRYFSDFPSIEDPEGHVSADCKKCPLDPAFAADWCAKVASVAAAHPKFICIEDDFTLAWGRGLDAQGACFCPRHRADFARRFGKELSAREIADAFERRTDANLPLRKAFEETVRESLVSLARQVREAIDRVDPSVRVLVCESAGAERDGDSLEPVARAFAGKTRPAVRVHGAIYGAQTTPASIPGATAHAFWSAGRLPDDIEVFYEADPYPHNRFFTSASQFLSMLSGLVAAGADDLMLYCIQYLDDPLEDPGYVDAFNRHRPQLEAVRAFIRAKNARLSGVRSVWTADDTALTRNRGWKDGHGPDVNSDNAFLCSKFGLPYTMCREGNGPALLIGAVPETLTDAEIEDLLKGGLVLDAVAADFLRRRGFGRHLGADVSLAPSRLPIAGEEILPAAGCACAGRRVNAFYLLAAGTEGTVKRFARLVPHAGTECWSRFTDSDGREITPSVTVATNALGGRVAVVATSMMGNRASGLYNLRKQELFLNLFRRLAPEGLPVAAVGVPGIWTLANVSADGQEMMVMLNNLSGDVRTDVAFAFARPWVGAEAERIAPDGSRMPLGQVSAAWRAPFPFGQMEPVVVHLRKSRKETR